jgi:hypothetical protein
MSKIETQLEINGVTYSGKDLDLIGLGMSLKEESIIKLLEAECYCVLMEDYAFDCLACQHIALIKGEK